MKQILSIFSLSLSLSFFVNHFRFNFPRAVIEKRERSFISNYARVFAKIHLTWHFDFGRCFRVRYNQFPEIFPRKRAPNFSLVVFFMLLSCVARLRRSHEIITPNAAWSARSKAHFPAWIPKPLGSIIVKQATRVYQERVTTQIQNQIMPIIRQKAESHILYNSKLS